MTIERDSHHTLLNYPLGDPSGYGYMVRGARLIWDAGVDKWSRDPKFLIHGAEDYEPAMFHDERDLVRFCLATLALVSIRDDDKLRDQVAQILKALVAAP